MMHEPCDEFLAGGLTRDEDGDNDRGRLLDDVEHRLYPRTGPELSSSRTLAAEPRSWRGRVCSRLVHSGSGTLGVRAPIRPEAF